MSEEISRRASERSDYRFCVEMMLAGLTEFDCPGLDSHGSAGADRPRRSPVNMLVGMLKALRFGERRSAGARVRRD